MVGFRENKLIVISPMVGSPAAKAGILPMDRIIRVDGEATEFLTLDEILLRPVSYTHLTLPTSDLV